LTNTPFFAYLRAERKVLEGHSRDMMSTEIYPLQVESISGEQIFNRCLQNSPKDAQIGAKVKKAYPTVKIPEHMYSQVQSNGTLKCYLVGNAIAEREQLRDIRVLRLLDFDAFSKRHNFHAFPLMSVNSNPVPLSFKLPPQNALEFRPEDKLYCIILHLEGSGTTVAKGISPSFRICMKISQFINTEAAQERLRRHTKRKPGEIEEFPPPQPHFSISRVTSGIMGLIRTVPPYYTTDLIEFLEDQVSALRQSQPAEREKKKVKVSDLLNNNPTDAFPEFTSAWRQQ